MKSVVRVFVAILCLGAPVLVLHLFHEKMPFWFGADQYTTRGQFGDQFGALNALFSGVAAGGLLLTLCFTLAQLRLLEREREDARQDRKKDERIDVITLRLRAVTSEIEIVSASTRIATVLFQEADVRCIQNPGNTFAISEREAQRTALSGYSTRLGELLNTANSIRAEYTNA
jgi:hypothetical protein